MITFAPDDVPSDVSESAMEHLPGYSRSDVATAVAAALGEWENYKRREFYERLKGNEQGPPGQLAAVAAEPEHVHFWELAGVQRNKVIFTSMDQTLALKNCRACRASTVETLPGSWTGAQLRKPSGA